MKMALVTGSAGFVGRHIMAKLLADGWIVTGCDIKNKDAHPQDCREAFKFSIKYDLVVHCAAVVGGRAKIDGQPMEVATDLAIDSDFFQYVLRTKPKHAWYFSSSAAYPIALQNNTGFWGYGMVEDDIDLDRIEQPDAIYGMAKLVGEMQARLANEMGANIQVFRPFSGYGDDQDFDYPFPTFIARAAKREDPFPIWGPGTQVRDWIHIDDVVEACYKTLDYNAIELGPVNLATGRGISLLGLAQICAEQVGYEPVFASIPSAPTGVMHRVGDTTKMDKFHEANIILEEGVERAIMKLSTETI